MRPTDTIETLLSDTPAPGVRPGPHRATLKQALLAEMRAAENAAAGKSPLRRIMRPRWIVPTAAAAAAMIAVAAAIFVATRASDRTIVTRSDSAPVAAPVPTGKVERVPAAPPPTTGVSAVEREALTGERVLTEGRVMRRKSLEQSVAEAQVIVVATALDAAPAPPKVPGDIAENLIRFRVARVLKGEMAQEFITTRTPTAPAEFIGREWVVMLSPEYMAGRHSYAGSYTIKLEPEVKTILGRGGK